jgi:hypothetical protein
LKSKNENTHHHQDNNNNKGYVRIGNIEINNGENCRGNNIEGRKRNDATRRAPSETDNETDKEAPTKQQL